MHGGKPYRLAPRRGAGAGLGRRAALQAEGIWQLEVDRRLESQLTHRSERGTVRREKKKLYLCLYTATLISCPLGAGRGYVMLMLCLFIF